MSRSLISLAPFDDDGALRVVVESPRGSRMKISYDPKIRAFTISRELPLGVAYPFDWGFIPGTRGDDGDPLDALVIHHQATYPGVVLPCRILGMVKIEQRERGAKRAKAEVNNRIVAAPAWDQTVGTLEDIGDVPDTSRRQIEHFFVAAVAFTGKQLTVKGWASRAMSERFVRAQRTGV